MDTINKFNYVIASISIISGALLPKQFQQMHLAATAVAAATSLLIHEKNEETSEKILHFSLAASTYLLGCRIGMDFKCLCPIIKKNPMLGLGAITSIAIASPGISVIACLPAFLVTSLLSSVLIKKN